MSTLIVFQIIAIKIIVMGYDIDYSSIRPITPAISTSILKNLMYQDIYTKRDITQAEQFIKSLPFMTFGQKDLRFS